MARLVKMSFLRFAWVLVLVCVSLGMSSLELGMALDPCWNGDICRCERPSPVKLKLMCTCTSNHSSLVVSASGSGERSLPPDVTELAIQSCANVTIGELAIAKLDVTSLIFSGIETLILRKDAFSQLARLQSLQIIDVRHLAAEEHSFSNVTSDALFVNNTTWPLVKSKTFSDVYFTNIDIAGSKFGHVERKGFEFRKDLESFNISRSAVGSFEPYSFYVGYADLFSMTDCHIDVFHENSTKIMANMFEFHGNNIGKVDRYALFLNYHILVLQNNFFGHTAELAFREVVPSKHSLIAPEIEFQLLGNTFVKADPHSLDFGDVMEVSSREDSNLKIVIKGNRFTCECSPLQWLLQLKQRDNTSDYFGSLYETSLCITSPRLTVKDYADAALTDDGICPEDVPKGSAALRVASFCSQNWISVLVALFLVFP